MLCILIWKIHIFKLKWNLWNISVIPLVMYFLNIYTSEAKYVQNKSICVRHIKPLRWPMTNIFASTATEWTDLSVLFSTSCSIFFSYYINKVLRNTLYIQFYHPEENLRHFHLSTEFRNVPYSKCENKTRAKAGAPWVNITQGKHRISLAGLRELPFQYYVFLYLGWHPLNPNFRYHVQQVACEV